VYVVSSLPCHLINSNQVLLVLNPAQKTEHIRKYWGDEKVEDILKKAEETVSLYICGMSATQHDLLILTV